MSRITDMLEELIEDASESSEKVVFKSIPCPPKYTAKFLQMEKDARTLSSMRNRLDAATKIIWVDLREEFDEQIGPWNSGHLRYNHQNNTIEVMKEKDEVEPARALPSGENRIKRLKGMTVVKSKDGKSGVIKIAKGDDDEVDPFVS